MMDEFQITTPIEDLLIEIEWRGMVEQSRDGGATSQLSRVLWVVDLCRHPECDRVVRPGWDYCCGSCHLAALVGYTVPATDSLGHFWQCEVRNAHREVCNSIGVVGDELDVDHR